MEIKIAKTTEDILKCWDVLKELRPHLEQESFVPNLNEMMKEGYILAFIEENNKAMAAIGFRYLHVLFNGKHYHIDDLSTLPEHRGKGLAGRLLDFVVARAEAEGYKVIALDSGYHRADAHRLYLNKGFT
ncbi:MAG: GNAT family N-acetyltransferase, partial [Mucilaginibacter sp.]